MLRWLKNSVPQKYKNYYHLVVAAIANAFFGFPSKSLRVIGVTGTDGKTTTSTLIYTLLKAAGLKVALFTSVAAYIGNDEIDTGFHVTTPDPFELQRLLKLSKDRGIKVIVLETTSHAFDQHRLFGINFEVGVLTNITPEHLDYHKTYDSYLNAKAKLFRGVKLAILNLNDRSYGLVRPMVNQSAKIVDYAPTISKGKVRAAIYDRFRQDYNRENATAAVCVAKYFKVKDDVIANAIKSFSGVPGRMEEIINYKGINIIVDFAHTSNGIKRILRALKKKLPPHQNLIAVFGCASERDTAKRPIMANYSTQIANYSIFTAEDPRHEDINKIIDQMVEGVDKSIATEVLPRDFSGKTLDPKQHYYFRIPERGNAISFAINKVAKEGDTVVICGKGHEKSMAYFGVEYPWSDFDAVASALMNKKLTINHP